MEIHFGKSRKHCGKRRKCWLPAFSPFPTMFSKGFLFRVVKSRDYVVKTQTPISQYSVGTYNSIALAHQFVSIAQELAGKHKMTLGGLESLQKKVVEEELLRWKRNQQLAGNGASFDATHIELIQKW